MKIGVPKEIKNHEYRVGLTPGGVSELVGMGHDISVETQCGMAIGFSDADYVAAGAKVVESAAEVFDQSQMIVKVKEPQLEECKMLKPDHILFTYLHLAPDPEQAKLLIASGASCIAYETVTDVQGGLPLLTPMSEVAGRMSIQAAAHCLENAQGGRGVLLGGVPGVEPAKILVIGGGVVGLHSARMAMGLGADVTIMDRSLSRLKAIDEMFSGRIKTLFSSKSSIEAQLPNVDAVIGAVLIPGASAPKLISRSMLGLMRPGSVLVDVAIDQGGCFETSHATTHENPTYCIDGVMHYCVANIPGAVARTSTMALTNATFPFVVSLANKGIKAALHDDEYLREGLNVCAGVYTNAAVAQAMGEPCRDALEMLG